MNNLLSSLLISLLTPLVLFSQTDSIPTIVLQRINDRGKPVHRIIEPNKKIKIVTSQDKKYKFNKIVFIGDSSILLNTDTVLLNNIKNIQAQYKGGRGKKTILIITGIVFLPIAIVGLLPRYGGSGDYSEWEKYNNGRIKYYFPLIIGISSFITGVLIPNNIIFNTENKWIIKVGDYNNDQIKRKPIDKVDNYN